MAKDLSSAGDAERQKEIDAQPETVEIAWVDGSKAEISWRATLQAQDDDWRRFRDSDMGRAILGANLEE